MRIKKKSAYIPFPQTVAYRMILLTISFLLFAYATYRSLASLYGDSLNSMILFFSFMAITGFGLFYNMSRLKDAKVSPTAARRMRRR